MCIRDSNSYTIQILHEISPETIHDYAHEIDTALNALSYNLSRLPRLTEDPEYLGFARGLAGIDTDEHRATLELAAWNLRENDQSVTGANVIYSNISAFSQEKPVGGGITLSRNGGVTFNIPATNFISVMDIVAANKFPIRVLLRKTHAGNVTFVNHTRVRFIETELVNPFTANQIRELVIDRVSGAGNTSQYEFKLFAGISNITAMGLAKHQGIYLGALGYMVPHKGVESGSVSGTM